MLEKLDSYVGSIGRYYVGYRSTDRRGVKKLGVRCYYLDVEVIRIDYVTCGCNVAWDIVS